jgi:glycosyltransferase involved in cell wall biosynthesis
MPDPLVSVIVPAYNADRFICRTLDSALSQSYSNLEVVVVDDGSTDRTSALVLDYCRRDSRVTLLTQPNLGVASARNLAIRTSRGEFVAPLDADDIWYPDKVRFQVEAIRQSDDSVGLIYSWALAIDEFDKIVGAFGSAYAGDVFFENIFFNVAGNASCVLIRRSCLEKVGLYDATLRQRGIEGVEDRDLHIRISRYCKFVCVHRYLVGYRMVPGSMSKQVESMHRSSLAVLEKAKQNYPELPTCLIRWQRSSLDFSHCYAAFAEGEYFLGFRLLLSSLARDPWRILWFLSLPVHLQRHPVEFARMFAPTVIHNPRVIEHNKIYQRHQQSLIRPDWFRRFNHRRLARIKKGTSSIQL